MRISDWSSDVCSSDLARRAFLREGELRRLFPPAAGHEPPGRRQLHQPRRRQGHRRPRAAARDEGRRRRGKEDAGQQGQEGQRLRSEEHTSELQSLMRISYAVFCLKKKKKIDTTVQQRARSILLAYVCKQQKRQLVKSKHTIPTS